MANSQQTGGIFGAILSSHFKIFWDQISNISFRTIGEVSLFLKNEAKKYPTSIEYWPTRIFTEIKLFSWVPAFVKPYIKKVLGKYWKRLPFLYLLMKWQILVDPNIWQYVFITRTVEYKKISYGLLSSWALLKKL